MQRAKEANVIAAQVFGVLEQRSDRLLTGVEDRGVASLLISAQQSPQFLGNRKSDDKMLYR